MRRDLVATAAAAAAALALSLLLPTTVAAQPAAPLQTLSRASVIERLKHESYVLLAGRYRISQARADVVAAGVWTNPNVTANLLTLTHGSVTGGQTEVIATVDQVLPIGGLVGLREDVARGFL